MTNVLGAGAPAGFMRPRAFLTGGLIRLADAPQAGVWTGLGVNELGPFVVRPPPFASRYWPELYMRLAKRWPEIENGKRNGVALLSLRAALDYLRAVDFEKESVARTSTGHIARSEAAKHAFEAQTGYPHGRPGYVIDHIVPLACGGADAPNNMQWQTIAAAKAKDRVERVGCR
jgi:hypothetical protein